MKCRRIQHSDKLTEPVIEDKHKRSAGAPEHVGKSAVEETTHTLVLNNLRGAVYSAPVRHGGAATRLHHQPPPDRVKGVRHEASNRSGDLSHDESLPHSRAEACGKADRLEGVEAAEEGGAVHDDAVDGSRKTLIQAREAVALVDLAHAVEEPIELPVLALADVSAQPGTSKVEGVDKHEGSGTGGTARGEVAEEEEPEADLSGGADEDLLVLVLERKVERLSGEVADDVGRVAAPEGGDPLILVDARGAVDDTGVRLRNLC
mmetsp:Transcript_18003/g.45383  ORF Transcript_18003/g.45383 Transcript_18003/m.45383 type:complete len:262 (+) Transcript_18003:183-968(+)